MECAMAIQTMDERVRVLDELITHSEAKGRTESISSMEARAEETKKYPDRLCQFLLALHQE